MNLTRAYLAMCHTAHYTLPVFNQCEHLMKMDSKNKKMLSDDAHDKLLKQLDIKPDSSQRELADATRICLGKVSNCLQAPQQRHYQRHQKLSL